MKTTLGLALLVCALTVGSALWWTAEPPPAAQAALPLTLLSFMGESRRLDNTRLRRELRLRLHYPTVAQGLRSV